MSRALYDVSFRSLCLERNLIGGEERLDRNLEEYSFDYIEWDILESEIMQIRCQETCLYSKCHLLDLTHDK